jgi:hypothetical protein
VVAPKRLDREREHWEILVVFANTGKEAEGTLFFVDEIAQEWGINVVWVEYSAGSKKGWKVKPVVVTYETASRKGEPFERMIACMGIPSTNVPICSDVLKKRTIMAYLRSIGWEKYYTAIGIRADELHRVAKHWVRERKFYPFAHIAPTLKLQVDAWWSTQSIGLHIHPDEGNCDNCWKKDTLRLCRNAQRNPRSFDWWQAMTDKYGSFNPRNTTLKPPFNFYRGNLSPKDIFVLSEKPIDEIKRLTKTEKRNTCNESCEAF